MDLQGKFVVTKQKGCLREREMGENGSRFVIFLNVLKTKNKDKFVETLNLREGETTIHILK